jgi:hypothetical protein
MAAQMRNFLDQTGGLWANGALVGKVGSAFSTTSQHGGHETALVSFHFTLLHHGMIVVGTPYSERRLVNMAEITGGTPYGATTWRGSLVHASQAKTSSPSPAFGAGMSRRSPMDWSPAANELAKRQPASTARSPTSSAIGHAPCDRA